MRYWVYHQGVPLGSADLGAGELIVAEFEPADAYGSVREVVRQASEALWGMGFFHSEGVQPRVSAEALGRAAALPLELRDADGKMVPADFVNIVERPHNEDGPVVFVRFRQAHASVASVLHPRRNRAGDASDPEA